jgi:IS30 family transposase
LTAKLRTGRPLRKRRRKPTERTPRSVAPAVLIHRRPPIVETRTRIGDWEGDLIVGKHNTNGLLRQFFPKGKDLSSYTPEDLARAEKLLNSRPRKILNWRTPDLVFAHGLL